LIDVMAYVWHGFWRHVGHQKADKLYACNHFPNFGKRVIKERRRESLEYVFSIYSPRRLVRIIKMMLAVLGNLCNHLQVDSLQAFKGYKWRQKRCQEWHQDIITDYFTALVFEAIYVWRQKTE